MGFYNEDAEDPVANTDSVIPRELTQKVLPHVPMHISRITRSYREKWLWHWKENRLFFHCPHPPHNVCRYLRPQVSDYNLFSDDDITEMVAMRVMHLKHGGHTHILCTSVHLLPWDRMCLPEVKASRFSTQGGTSRHETAHSLIEAAKNRFMWEPREIAIESNANKYVSHQHVREGSKHLKETFGLGLNAFIREVPRLRSIRSAVLSKRQCKARNPKTVLRRICIWLGPSRY